MELTETGTSLRANELRIIDTVITSTTRFIANKQAWDNKSKRQKIENISILLNAAIEGKLGSVLYEQDPIFGVQVPTECPGVPSEVLNARSTWQDKKAYDKKADHLAGLFEENFREYADQAAEEVVAAGPKVGGSVARV